MSDLTTSTLTSSRESRRNFYLSSTLIVLTNTLGVVTKLSTIIILLAVHWRRADPQAQLNHELSDFYSTGWRIWLELFSNTVLFRRSDTTPSGIPSTTSWLAKGECSDSLDAYLKALVQMSLGYLCVILHSQVNIISITFAV